MIKNQTIKRVVWGIGVVLLLSGCAKGITSDDSGKVRIGFAAPEIEEEIGTVPSANKMTFGATTRATLLENTTVRVVAYVAGSMTYVADQAYYMNGGKLRPCSVDANGLFTAVDLANELALLPGSYDFYAITPALPLNSDKKTVSVSNGVDYASSLTSNINVTADRTLALTQLSRKCSKIALVVKAGEDNTLMTALSVAADGVTINALPATAINELNKPIVQASGTTSLNVPQTAFKTLNATETSAITYLLPRLGTDRMKIDYKLTYTISGASGGTETKLVSGTMGNTILEAGKSYTFTLTMRKAGASLAVTEWIESNQEVVTGESLDYTDNGGSWFLIAAGDAMNPIDGTTTMNWYQANGVVDATTNPDGKKACSDGWRVPTKDEAQIAWIYENAMPDFHLTTKSMADYAWTATEVVPNVWGIGRTGGTIMKIPKGALKNLRCIRNVSSPTKKYPYVEKDASGKAVVIVSRDAFGGVKKDALHPTWQITPSHNYTQAGNKVSAKFVVAVNNCDEYNAPGVTQVNGTYVWSDIDAACAAYSENGVSAGSWRSPTYRELQLIYLMYSNNMITGITIPVTIYWTKTEGLDSNSPISWFINMTTQETGQVNKTNSYSVRCVRDVQ